MATSGWNSGNLGRKKEIVHKAACHDDFAASETSGVSHDSFPVHALGAEEGYEGELVRTVVGPDPEELACSESGDAPAAPLADSEIEMARESIARKVSEKLDEMALKQKSVVLRPYGGQAAVEKAKGICEAVLLRQTDNDGTGEGQLRVGEPVTEIGQLCQKVGESPGFLGEVGYGLILHQESTVDVRALAITQFGNVVQKTYLKQTMRAPHRRHSSMEEQLLYEVCILKSLAAVPGVVRLLGWRESIEMHWPHRPMKSLIYGCVYGNHTPTEPADVLSYITQLLRVFDHLHRLEIVHCNVKRANVLFDFNQRVTLIDFETAVREHELIDMGQTGYDEEATVFYQSNPYFSAPEVLKPQKGRNKHGKVVLYGHRRDMYGVGIILAEILLKMEKETHLLHRVNVEREARWRQRQEFETKLDGMDGSMREALRGLAGFTSRSLYPTSLNLHGADLVKHLTLMSRFKRARASEALQHSFCKLDPDSAQEEARSFEYVHAQCLASALAGERLKARLELGRAQPL